MPEEVERKLKTAARKKWPGNKKRQDAYVFGTLNKIEDRRKKKGNK